jgi:dTMP kinase
MAKAKFIVLEGIDGAGKSTAIQGIKQWMAAHQIMAHFTFEPTSSPIGSLIRNVFSGRIQMDEKTIAALFLSDRLDHIQNKKDGMLMHLSSGKSVVSDRYYLSSYAYHVPYVPLDWVIDANLVCAELMKPDLTFYLDISLETSLHRLQKGRQSLEIFETRERIQQVKNNYEAAIEKLGDTENIKRLDAEQNPDDLIQDIGIHLKELFSI